MKQYGYCVEMNLIYLQKNVLYITTFLFLHVIPIFVTVKLKWEGQFGSRIKKNQTVEFQINAPPEQSQQRRYGKWNVDMAMHQKNKIWKWL